MRTTTLFGRHVAFISLTLRLQSKRPLSSFLPKEAIATQGLKHDFVCRLPLPTLETSPNTTLQQLVQNSLFEAAEGLHRHLITEGVHIQRHPAYERAALEALNVDQNADLESFVMWLDLYPGRGHTLCPSEDKEILKAIRTALFQRGHPRKSTKHIKAFALVCAREGLLEVVYDEIVHVLVSCMERRELVEFLVLLESKVSVAEKPKWRNRATQVLAYAGYSAEAVDMVSRDREGGFPLSSETYAKVATAVSGAGEVSKILKQVRERDLRLTMRNGERWMLGVGMGKRRGQWEGKLADEQTLPLEKVPQRKGLLGFIKDHFSSLKTSKGRREIVQAPRTVLKDPSLPSQPSLHGLVYPVVREAAVAYRDSLPLPPGGSSVKSRRTRSKLEKATQTKNSKCPQEYSASRYFCDRN